ncbi:unnamed protein product [Callosobruchus maculatus]|uniref:Uncharacterized protein n=1 Tax=Callosobruchus maculatus TaxID=64391 RepID=A0A653DEH8_CALMS|nr:unnamed protein product [Callosobruchus maculatus]
MKLFYILLLIACFMFFQMSTVSAQVQWGHRCGHLVCNMHQGCVEQGGFRCVNV